MAVLPTPGSPTRSGLFLRRRHSTCTQRSTSRSRPMSGSTSPLRDFAFRSTQYLASADSFWSSSPSDALSTTRLFFLGFGRARDRPAFAKRRVLGHAVGDEVDRIVAGHVLGLKEIGGIGFTFREDRDQHIGTGHFRAAGRLCTWIAARWITRWKAAVGTASDPSTSVSSVERSSSMKATKVPRNSSISTLHARMTFCASGSSRSASSRCSRLPVHVGAHWPGPRRRGLPAQVYSKTTALACSFRCVGKRETLRDFGLLIINVRFSRRGFKRILINNPAQTRRLRSKLSQHQYARALGVLRLGLKI